MKFELPKFKRCCFCIPLRYGLLVWAYIKLVLSLLMFLFGALLLQMYMQLIFMVGFGIMPIILMGMALLLFLMVDIAMSVVFLIGGHRKTIKLMRIFYVYSIVLMCVIAVVLLMSTIYDLTIGDNYNDKYARRRYRPISYGALVTTKVVFGVIFLVVQAYVILLLRSEIDKLTNSRNFRFTNIGSAAECSMENKNSENEKNINIANDQTYKKTDIDETLSQNSTKNDNNFTNSFNYNKLNEI